MKRIVCQPLYAWDGWGQISRKNKPLNSSLPQLRPTLLLSFVRNCVSKSLEIIIRTRPEPFIYSVHPYPSRQRPESEPVNVNVPPVCVVSMLSTGLLNRWGSLTPVLVRDLWCSSLVWPGLFEMGLYRCLADEPKFVAAFANRSSKKTDINLCNVRERLCSLADSGTHAQALLTSLSVHR